MPNSMTAEPTQTEVAQRERKLRLRAAYENGFKDYSPWADSTGARTHALVYKNLAFSDRNLGELFLVNTRLQRSDESGPLSIARYFNEVGTVLLELQHRPPAHNEHHKTLSAGPPMDLSVALALENRRSIREYTGDPISLDVLGALLRCSAGVTATATFDDPSGTRRTLSLRTVPSGGGLYPVELMVFAKSIDGLPRGLYRYVPATDTLAPHPLAAGDDEIRAAFDFPEEFITYSRAAAVVFFVATPWKSLRKYGSRGVRYVLHECGSMALALHLGATALGVATVDCASFYDDEINSLLGVDGVASAVIHTIFAGYGRDR